MERKAISGIMLTLLVVGMINFVASGSIAPSISSGGGSTVDWWPMFRHDLRHTGYSTSEAPNTNQTLWSYTTGSYVHSSPAVADGKVFVGSVDAKVYAFGLIEYAYVVPWEGISFWVAILSNSIIENFNFSQPLKQISFNVTGSPGTSGFCNITIPKSLLGANETHPWQVLLDGNPISYTKVENATHTSIYFTYTHSAQTVKIIGTWVVPEFPSWALALLMLFVLAAGVALSRKRMQSPVEYSSNCQVSDG